MAYLPDTPNLADALDDISDPKKKGDDDDITLRSGYFDVDTSSSSSQTWQSSQPGDVIKYTQSRSTTSDLDFNNTQGTIKIDPDPVVGGGSSSGNSINIGGNLNTFTVGPDPETVEKVKEAVEKQQEKIDTLREVMIEYLAENEISTSEKMSWKSDFNRLREAEQSLPDTDEPMQMTEDAVLDPDVLERLNAIYKRWSS
jgi:hypothetical protein